MAQERDYYATLQVSRNAGIDEIDRAYERLKKVYDPATSRKPRAAQRFAEIEEAYSVLGDRVRRREYDRDLNRRLAAAGSMSPADVLNNRVVWSVAAGIIISIAVIVAAVLILGGGDDGDEAVLNTGTPTPLSTPSPTPFGQTPKPTPPATPPEVTVEPVTTESGLQIYTIQEGTGDPIAVGDTAYVEYTGWLESTGAMFDSSYNPGASAFPVNVGSGVISGWTEGLQQMKEGGKYRLVIPPDLAYGAAGRPPQIPENSTLIFDMEPINVLKPGETLTPTPTFPPTDTPTAAATDTGAAGTETAIP